MELIILLVFGTIVAVIAQTKGRNAIGWFLIGFFTGLIGLILILVLSDLKKEEQERHRLNEQNRRLRERARKDRMVANRRHREVKHRLRAHDRTLGVDTEQRQPRHLDYDDDDFDDDFDDDVSDEYEDEDPPASVPVRRPRRLQS